MEVEYKNAIKEGAKESFPPEDLDYENRQGEIIDLAGNFWFSSKR